MLKIPKNNDDDPNFINEITSIINGSIYEYKPNEIYLIKIRNWFDNKWCHFSGKVLGALGISLKKLTVPPFVPNRVIYQKYFIKKVDDQLDYIESVADPLHINQPSSDNLHRYISTISKNCIFIWYSSDSMKTSRGSLMVYNISLDMELGWHVTFFKKDKWQIDKATFLSKPMIEGLKELGEKHSL